MIVLLTVSVPDHVLMMLNVIPIVIFCEFRRDLKTLLQAIEMYGAEDLAHTALAIAGCSSNSPLLPNIYVLKLQHAQGPSNASSHSASNLSELINNTVGSVGSSPRLEVRLGYFGYCTSSGGSPLCGSAAWTPFSLQPEDPDLLTLITLAHKFRANVLFPYFV